MTTPTTGAAELPEALRLAASLELCWGDSRLDKAAAELRRLHAENERLAALVEAQQPTTHVQNLAENEHVAGDVSKNGPESNMAQQPVPSAAADLIAALEEARSAINSMKVEAETAAQGDEQMMLEACETISNEGLQADMAIRAALASAPQPAPTPQADPLQPVVSLQEQAGMYADDFAPQADSQPAPVRGEPTWTVFNSGAQVAEVESLAEAMEYLTPERLSRQWCAVCVVDQSNMPKASAPADSVTAPAGGPAMPAEFLRGVIALCTQRGYSPENIEAWSKDDKWIADLWRQAERLLAAAPTPPAQAADSVLEDAARLERERICAAIKAEDDYCVDHGDYMLDSDDCIKIVRGEWVRPDFAVDAASKQGGA